MTVAATSLEAHGELGSRYRHPGQVAALVLSLDPALRAVLRAAVDERHECLYVESADAAVDTLVATPCGVLIADLALVRGDVAGLFISLHEQFPDLVLIACGSREDEALASELLSSEVLFRFLHKPTSPARASLFLNSAIERHLEATGRGPLGRLINPGFWRRAQWGAALLLAVLALGAAWWLLRTPTPPATAVRSAPSAPATSVTDTLNRARAALQAGRIVAPPGDNALELFGDVLATSPDEPEALDGLRRVVDQLLRQAEDALAADDFRGARDPLEYVRLVKPDHPRLNFLDAQIARAQAAREAAERAALEPQETPQQARLRRLLGLADRRLASGALLGPARDDARHYVLAARAIDPADPEVRSVAGLTGASLVERGVSAIDAGNLDEAQRWSSAAEAFAGDAGIAIRGLDRLSRRITDAVANRSLEAASRHLELAAERLDAGAWIAPAGDSARDHLVGARAQGADTVVLAPLEQRLFAGLVGETRAAIQQGELAHAADMLDAAKRLAPEDDTLAEIGMTLASAQARQVFLDDVVPAATLTRTKTVAASYPREAVRRGTEGHVEVRFTVARDGSTREFEVVVAEPVGVFEEAAIEALRGWRFEPVMKNGEPAEQRASVRMKFQLAQE